MNDKPLDEKENEKMSNADLTHDDDTHQTKELTSEENEELMEGEEENGYGYEEEVEENEEDGA